mgnify:CR=1 FL=1
MVIFRISRNKRSEPIIGHNHRRDLLELTKQFKRGLCHYTQLLNCKLGISVSIRMREHERIMKEINPHALYYTMVNAYSVSSVSQIDV